MNEIREMTCIVCPVGCRLKAQTVDGKLSIQGNTCVRGEKYALEELTNPTRTVTTSVTVKGGHTGLLSVKSRIPVPKGSITAVLKELRTVTAAAPVKAGDVVLSNAAGSGVDIVATRSVRLSHTSY
jgi:CxxC motif-containing protein